MKRKLLFAALCVVSALGFNVNAQDAGTYYIQNVGNGKWLGPGNSWGTQASVLNHADYWKAAKISDGVYTLESVVSNGGTNYYLSGTYCDGGATNFTLTSVAGKENTYTIANGSSYLTTNGTIVDVSATDGNAVASQWKLWSEADMSAGMAAATIAAPFDATYLIKDHDLGRNNRDYSSWNNTGATAPKSSAGNAATTVYSIEAYQKTFDVNQTLSDIPNGVYAVRVNGFYRQDGSDANLPYVYANDSKTTLPVRTGTENNMQDAAVSFVAGNYLSEPAYVQVSDGTLKIGVATTGSSCWVIFKNFHLQYYGDVTVNEVVLYEYIQLYNAALAAAQSYQDDDMFTDDKTALNTAVTNNTLDTSTATQEQLTTATANLNAAATAAATAAAKYNTYTTAVTTINGGSNVDLTSLIVNPSFETGDLTGWTTPTTGNDTGVKTNPKTAGQTYYMDHIAGDKIFNTWANSVKTLNLTQTIGVLPEGIYEIKAWVSGYADGAAINLDVNGNTVNVTPAEADGKSYQIVNQFGIADKSDVTFTVSNTGKGNTFFMADDFELVYVGSFPDLTAVDGKMSTDAATAQTTALTNYNNGRTIETYNAAVAAIAAAQASKDAYVTAKTAIDKANAIKDANNFVTAAATTTFADAIAAISDAYDDGTLSDADATAAGLTLGTAVSVWHANASAAAVAYISSAWSEISMPNNADWSAYYINTWSTEGDNDGTNFSVPFFEYWVNSGSLAAKTMTGELSGLTPNQLYKVTADVRVQYSSKVDGSITLTVGEGTAVDVTSGSTSGQGDLHVGSFNAFGKADADGKLTVKFVVAENSGISWLSWQNVSYEETSLDFSELQSAIVEANTANAKVTNGVASLATAITTAQGLLTSATTQEEVNAGVTALNAAKTAAESIIAARLKLAGTVKKATALKDYLDENIDTEISEATTYVSNADATEADATNKTNALNAHFSSWTTVSLTNGGFDSDINIAADGTNSGTASAIEKNTGEKATLYNQTGWTSISKHASTAAHSASAVYGAASASTKGTNSTNAPTADMYGATAGGVLQISAGWADQARYEQAIASLPAGKYVFYYEAFNANSGATAINGNFFGIGDLTAGDLQGTNNTFKYSDTKSYASNTWIVDAFEFDLGKDVTTSKVKIGVQGTDSSHGSGAGAKLWIDNVTIYCIGNADVTVSEEQTSAFAATDANVTLTRTLKGGQWNGFSVPFGFTIAGSALDGAEVKEFASVTDNEIALQDATAIVAGNPYLVKPASDIVNPTFEGVSVTAATDVVKGEGDYTFQAHLYATDLAIDGSVAYMSTTDSKIKKLTSGSIKGLRAIFNIPTSSSAKALVVRFDNTPTGILSVDAEGNVYEGAIYNLAGQKLNAPVKGINIIGGKKVVVK